MARHIETRLIWEEVSTYKNEGDGVSVAHEPEVLLWHPKYGYQLGRCFAFAGEVITVSAAHGFIYTHFARLENPEQIP